MDKNTIKVLLIDDTFGAYIRCKELLGESYEVLHAKNPNDAWVKLEEMKSNNELFDVIILDLALLINQTEGLLLLPDLVKKYPNIPVLVWTKHAKEYGEKALQNGAKKVIEKFIKDEQLEPSIRELCHRYKPQ